MRITANHGTRTVFRTCTLCDASCGLELDVDGTAVRTVRGDPLDPLSRGYVCPKGLAIGQLHEDPDRLRRPLWRTDAGWKEIGWPEALDRAAAGLASVRRDHGEQAVAVYSGEPLYHNFSAMLFVDELVGALGNPKRFSCSTLDQMPRALALHWIYGNGNFIPVPDVERTDHLLLIGANTAVTHGGMMTTPDARNRLREIQRRGGRVVVIDPRRSETAALADRHHFIRPGTDGLLLAAMLSHLFTAGAVRVAELPDHVAGLEALRAAVAPFRPEAVSDHVGIATETIRELASEFAAAPSAVAYGHIGTKVTSFGTTTSWLIEALNVVTGNLDRPGGAMIPAPGIDAAGIQPTPAPGRFRSRISGTPEFMGELPAATLVDEMQESGEGRVRGLVTIAGNPVLSAPSGRRLSAALDGLDCMVAVDFYLNETTRHAQLILPPVGPLERDHYELTYHHMAIRNTAHWSPRTFDAPAEARSDATILLELANRLHRRRGLRGAAASLPSTIMLGLGAERVAAWILAALVRIGPHGSGLRLWKRGLSLGRIRSAIHGVDLGPMTPALPARLPKRVDGSPRRVDLAPPDLLADLGRLAKPRSRDASKLVLIGRRDLRSINSWGHNWPSLMTGRDRCHLRIHPEDAGARGITGDRRVRLRSAVGEIEVPVVLTDELMRGVVSLPHGYGHARQGSRLSVAEMHAGASINDLIDWRLLDPLSGTAVLNETEVEVEPA